MRAGRIGAGGARPRRVRQDRDGPRRRRLRDRRRPAGDRRRDHREGGRRARRCRACRRARSPASATTSPTGRCRRGRSSILDEISQTSTRDAHDVLAAVDACPGGQLWVLGDPQQAPSVKAGGIAAEIAARADAETIPAARLTVNRRQVDPDDRHALHILRCGDAHASQQLRREHGWEHTAATPEDTRRAMADAVTADILASGAETTIALVVSHAQAEDLTDRIRRRLTDAGTLTGTSITGPGWTTDRHYQAGDRMLLHTRHGDRHSPLVNGTVGTIDRSRRPGCVVPSRPGRTRPTPSRLHPRQSGGRVTERVPRLGTHRRRRPGRHLGPRPPARHRRARRLPRLHRPIPLHPPHPHLEHRHLADRRLRRPPRPRPRPRPSSRRRPVPHPRHDDGRRQRPVDRRHPTTPADRRPPGSSSTVNRPTDDASSTRPPANSPPPATTLAAAEAAVDDVRRDLDEIGVLAPLTRHGRAERRALDDRLQQPAGRGDRRRRARRHRRGPSRATTPANRPPTTTTNTTTVGAATRSTTPGNGSTSTGPTSRSPASAPTRPSPTASNRSASAADTSPANSPPIEASLPPDRSDERDRARTALRTQTAATARPPNNSSRDSQGRARRATRAAAGHDATRPPSARPTNEVDAARRHLADTERIESRRPRTPHRPQPPSARLETPRSPPPPPSVTPSATTSANSTPPSTSPASNASCNSPTTPPSSTSTSSDRYPPAPPAGPSGATKQTGSNTTSTTPTATTPTWQRLVNDLSVTPDPRPHRRSSHRDPAPPPAPTDRLGTHHRARSRDPRRDHRTRPAGATADSKSSSASDPESRSLFLERIPGVLSRRCRQQRPAGEAETCLREPRSRGSRESDLFPVVFGHPPVRPVRFPGWPRTLTASPERESDTIERLEHRSTDRRRSVRVREHGVAQEGWIEARLHWCSPRRECPIECAVAPRAHNGCARWCSDSLAPVAVRLLAVEDTVMGDMDTCRVCGASLRDEDDVVVLDEHKLHAACVESHKEPKRRRVGAWAAMGSRGQMAMGDVQRDTPR